MNNILRAAVVFSFAAGLSSACASKTLWAYGEGGEQSSHKSGEQTTQTKTEDEGKKAEIVKDPVCGMEIDDIKKAKSEEYKGKVYYFCSNKCVKTFKKNPAPYTCGCATKMKECDCGHCKGKEETCPCLSEKEEGETHEHTGVESHETKHKHD